MKQMTFSDAEYAGKRKQTRKELFLIEMDRVVPWKGLIALIDQPTRRVMVVVQPIR
jgi:IS5 family transposase